MKIFVDMDGILSNFVGGVAELYDMTSEELEYKLWEAKTYHIHEVLGITEPELWDEIEDAGVDFWLSLDRYDEAKKLLWELHKLDHKVYIASDPGDWAYSLQGKVNWLRDNTHARFNNYCFTKHKHLLADEDSILIDDNLNNLADFNRAGGYAIRYPRPWNYSEGEEYKPNIREIIEQVKNADLIKTYPNK
jgi:5'(3')-deoxyribonucleotidase